MCLVYNISAISNPNAEVFEQFAATDFARTITYDHPRPLRPIVQSVYDLPTIPTFLEVAAMSQHDRKPGVTGALLTQEIGSNIKLRPNSMF